MAAKKKKSKNAGQAAANGEAAISVAGVSVGYEKNQAVIHDINLTVGHGETFGLMGLNGAGKTTLIKALLALRPPDQGEITLMGQSTQNKIARESLAYLPEKFEPPYFLTGEEFIRFSLSLYARAYDEEAVMAAVDRLSLDRGAFRRRATTYSKGMRQKLGLLGTILTGCPLLVLDEPMSGLDPMARALVKDELMAFREKGGTVFLCSHILADMDEICDRVGVLHDGVLRFTGTPSELKSQTGEDYLERAFLACISKGDEKKAA